MKIVLEGEYRAWASLAHINRALGAELAGSGELDFVAVDVASPPDARVPVSPSLAARLVGEGTMPQAADVRVRHAWPPAFARRGERRFAVCLPWEFGELPVAWRDEIAAGVDQVWAYSSYVRDVYARAGVPAEKIAVVPPGVEPDVVRPDGPRANLDARGFRFLFVGGSTPRKGVDLAVNAFIHEFTRGEDVSLVVKDASVLYPGGNVGAQIARVAATPTVAHVLYLDRLLAPAELAALYRSCDVLVAPYRGEGFGMPILEAMASGLPVIATAGGASDDFVDETVGIRIPATRRGFPPEDALPLVGEGWLLEPDLGALRSAMRELYENRPLVGALGAAALARAGAWTWTDSAAAARAALMRLAAS